MNLKFTKYITDDRFNSVVIPEIFLESIRDAKDIINKNEYLVYNQLYEGIKYAIENDLLTVPILRLMLPKPENGTFLFKNVMSPFTIIINRDKFNEALQYCLKYYECIEEYEKCAIIIKLINE